MAEVLKPGESLVEKTGELLLASGGPSGWTVVFPGKRPGHFLRKYLAEKSGGALKAPSVTSMDGFMELAAEKLGVKGRPAAPLDLAAVLYGRLKKELCEVIGRGEGELPLDAFLPWALKLTGDFEELRIELKGEKELAGYDSLLPEDLRTPGFIRKLESFSRLYGKFYAELEREELLTRSERYARVAARAAELGTALAPEKVVFAGLFALTAAERAVLKALAARGAAVLLAPGPGLEEQFSFLGKLPPAPKEKGPLLKLYKAPDLHGEIFRLAGELKDPGPGDVVVLPDSRALFPLVEHALPAGSEYNVSMGYPLSATPVFALLDSLGDLLDRRGEAGYFTPDYLKFVFHPYVKNIYLGGSAEAGRVVFQAVEERLSERAGRYVELREIEDDRELLETAAARLASHGAPGPEGVRAHLKAVHGALLRPFEEIPDLAGFSARLLALISHVSENSTAPLHAYWGPFVETAIARVTELGHSRLAGESFAGAGGYFKFLKTFLQGESYPFPGTPLKGLQVLGFLETRGLKFRRVFFLDANADLLPAARKEDTVLSHFVRERLGLSTYKTRERLARYYFGALLGGAEEAHVFYKDSADQERSPFVEKLAWDLERAGRRPEEDEVHLKVDFSQAEPVPVKKTPALAAALKAREFSPSALDAYLACGLRFYYRYGLRLSEKEALSGEIEQRDIGVIVHAALASFFKEKTGAPLNILEQDYAKAREAAQAVFEEKLKGYRSGFEYLIRRQVERRLSDILDYHRDELPGVTVLSCETELKASLKTRFGEVRLKGYADRVDQRGGKVHIVDYKTGSSASVPNWQRFDPAARADWPSTLKSVQLPFYLLAYLDGHPGASAADMDASLMLLGCESVAEEALFKAYGKKTPDRAAVLASYAAAMTALLEEILDPAVPFRPAADEKECGGCAFRGLCGRQWAER
jgi:RecB family exonuclease